MVDALVSGASAERRVGSSPILGTSKGVFFKRTPFSFARIELVQLVAPRATSLAWEYIYTPNRYATAIKQTKHTEQINFRIIYFRLVYYKQ